jgi:hypothetical protein
VTTTTATRIRHNTSAARFSREKSLARQPPTPGYLPPVTPRSDSQAGQPPPGRIMA